MRHCDELPAELNHDPLSRGTCCWLSEMPCLQGMPTQGCNWRLQAGTTEGGETCRSTLSGEVDRLQY
jgi:hypothetical protein